MGFILTNQKSSQALRGQNVKITLSAADAATYLDTLYIGMECRDDASFEFLGFIYSIDYKGNSFEVAPIQPDKTFQDAQRKGYFNADSDVFVGTI